MPLTSELLANLQRKFCAARNIAELTIVRKETLDHCLPALEIDQAIERECEQQLGLMQRRADLVYIYEADLRENLDLRIRMRNVRRVRGAAR